MQQKAIRRLLLLVLILALLPLNAFCETGTTILAAPSGIMITGSHERPEGYVPYYSHPLKDTPSADELPRNAFDQRAFDEKLAQYEALMQETDHEAELIALYEALLSDVCLASGDNAIAGFDADHDITDLALLKKEQETNTVLYEARKAFYRVNGEIMRTPYAEAFTDYWGEALAGSFAGYDADASGEDYAQQDASAAFLEKRQSLLQRYVH